MEVVILDLKKYLKTNIFPSKTVLVFPPFNGFRRFLIHKLIEDNFASSDVAAFSIGQETSRRIVVCYKGLIRTEQNKLTPVTAPKQIRPNMIDTDGSGHQKSTPKIGVYRPPAARIAEARQKASEAKTDPSKRTRVRRPDQQMYVPRPKRASFGNEQPRSRSRSSSRTSFESDSSDKKRTPRQNGGDSVVLESNETRNLAHCKKDDEKVVTEIPSHSIDKKDETLPILKINSRLTSSKCDNFTADTDAEVRLDDKTAINPDLIYTCSEPPQKPVTDVPCQCISDSEKQINLEVTAPQLSISDLDKQIDLEVTAPQLSISDSEKQINLEVTAPQLSISDSEKQINLEVTAPQLSISDSEKQVNLEVTAPQLIPSDCASNKETSTFNEMLTDSPEEEGNVEFYDGKRNCKVDGNVSLGEQESAGDRVNETGTENNDMLINNDSSDSCGSAEKAEVDNRKLDNAKFEAMETISLSSESSSPTTTTSSSDSKDSSSDSEPVQHKSKSGEMMDIDISNDSSDKKVLDKTICTIERNSNKKRNPSSLPVVPDDVFIISDSSSSNDNLQYSKENASEEEVENAKKSRAIKEKRKKPSKKKKNINPDSLDWESLYDDSGECLVPDLIEELTKSVGKVRVTSADSDYRPYQSIEERTNDGECVIEIYDFPAEFKTTDLMNIFAAYRNKNFQLKWVDDTHALGVFPSPLMADEVLACTLPFVKTRPLRFGITESRNKARNLILPPLPSIERPKTCTALARRLVTGALGLRLPTSSQDREKEKQLLKEAREKRRLEAKQREAAWDGTLTSTNCV